jgi:hypothetical protein
MAMLYRQKGNAEQAQAHDKKVIASAPKEADLSHCARNNLKCLGK